MLLLLLFLVPSKLSAHPCDAEVAAACPDRATSEIAQCLKDPSEHETPTSLSSECTDFVALNVACGEDIDTWCDEALFSDETTVCLTEQIGEDQHSDKCKSVMAWALPEPEVDEESSDGPTDELGLSEKDYAEKKEWQAKRRAQRGDAIERMKMKEADKKKEDDRLASEKFKRDDPEGYAQMLQQQEEELRQQQEQKRRERMQAAALERKKREESGAADGEEPKPKKKKKSKDTSDVPTVRPGGTSTLTGVLCLGLIACACVGGYFLVKRTTDSGSKPEKRKKKKA